MIASGEYTPCCSFCNSSRMSKVMDFGTVALAGGFLKPEQFAAERKFPLRLYFCNDCFAVQVVDKVPGDVLFHNYFYFSSSIGTLREHFKTYAAEVAARFLGGDQQWRRRTALAVLVERVDDVAQMLQLG